MIEDKINNNCSSQSEHSDKEEIKQIKLPKYLFMGRKKSNIPRNQQDDEKLKGDLLNLHQNELQENFFD